ncbi:MAG: hypothetical protein P1P84_01105 [Deferrisomatales bacterium]|nr:hypothetical protein [Deferrisomatales bacterium]
MLESGTRTQPEPGSGARGHLFLRAGGSAPGGRIRISGYIEVTVGDLARVWLRAYVRETHLGRV